MKTGYELVAITDEVTTCGSCGRSDLKKTYAIRPESGGEVSYYGSECAQRILYVNQKELNQKVNKLKKAVESAKQSLEWRISQHPLMIRAQAETQAFWNQTPRPSYAEYKAARATHGWLEMQAQARQECEAQ